MTYIIVQTVLKKQENKGNTVNNFWENIVTKVDFNNVLCIIFH